jgi:hypothetical protein
MQSLLALAALLCTAAHAERLLVHPCSHVSGWHGDNGGEYPGAKVSTGVVHDVDRGPCLEGRFKFGGDSRYSGLRWEGRIARAKAVGFWVKLPDHGGGSLRIRDATEQELLGGFTAEAGQWVNVEVPLEPGNFPGHWSGANDGQFHFPLLRVLVAVSRGPDQSSLRVSDLYVVVDDPAPEERWGLTLDPGVPTGVAFRGERAEYTAHVTNRLQRPAQCTLRVESTSLEGRTRRAGEWPVALDGWQTQDVTFRLPTRETGYWKLAGTLTDAEVGALPPAPSALVVVPRARRYGEWAQDAYFGMQSILDHEAAERLGCKAVRNAPGWRWGEAQPGDPYLREYLEGAVSEAHAHRMDVLATLQFYPPGWAQWQVEGRPKLADLPDPARFDEVARVARVAAEVFAGRATAIEIQNEPDLTCWVHPELSFEEGVDYYVRLLQTSREAIRAVDPDVPIAGLDVSGGDFDTGLRYTRAVLERGAELLDLYTGHPYASPRYFGPGLSPLFPMPNRMAEKCRDALDLFASFGRPRRMWIGELGWGLHEAADPLGEYSLDFAACIAQSLIVGKTVPGVEKNLYFTMQGCNESGHEYGLVRGAPAYPLPAALAYATTAYVLDAARPVELVRPAAGLHRATFACEERNELIVVWWTDGDAVSLKPPKSAPAGRWTDGYLRPLRSARVARLPVSWVLPLDEVGQQPRFLDDVRVEAPEAVALDPFTVDSLDRVTLVLTNRTNTAQTAEVEVEGRKQRLSIAPGATARRYEVTLAPPLPVGEAREVHVALTVGGERREMKLPVHILPLAAPPPGFEADANLGEWSNRAALEVDERSAVLPPDPNVGWDGPEDLSLRAYLAADDRGLYLAVAVTDDRHVADSAGPDSFWNSDSLQIALDPGNDSRDGFGEDDREFGLVLSGEGPRAFVTYPLPRHPLDIPLAATRREPETLYEAFVPWEALGIPPPGPGRLLALNFIANENDGRGRAYWMGLTPGIGEGKSPQVYRRFVGE